MNMIDVRLAELVRQEQPQRLTENFLGPEAKDLFRPGIKQDDALVTCN
jgi:hypothetical protein